MIYSTQKDVLDALRTASKGQERAEILAVKENRLLVLNSGAGFTMYAGEVRHGNSIKDKLSGINVVVMKRLNAKAGTPDGLGTFGGLAERTNPFNFYHMTLEEKISLVGKKDDVIIKKGKVVLTKDMDIIRTNNALRETKEELADLGITDITIDSRKLEHIRLKNVKDDNYITNIWDGNGFVYAINPYCHILKTNEEFIDYLEYRSKTANLKENSEVRSVEKRSLFDVLPRFGKKDGKFTSEDGRDMLEDYRYPHEWLMTWVIAAKALDHNETDMIKLATEVQQLSKHLIDFNATALRMKVDLSSVADALGISEKCLKKMQTAMTSIYKNKFVQKNRY